MKFTQGITIVLITGLITGILAYSYGASDGFREAVEQITAADAAKENLDADMSASTRVVKDDLSTPTQPLHVQYCQDAGLAILSPEEGDTVTFPLTVTGIVHPLGIDSDPWAVFEGEAGTVIVQDTATGADISNQAILSLTGPWMHSDPKPFSIMIPELTSAPTTENIKLFFRDGQAADPPEGYPTYCVLNLLRPASDTPGGLGL